MTPRPPPTHTTRPRSCSAAAPSAHPSRPWSTVRMSADVDGQSTAAGARAHPSLTCHHHSRLRAGPRLQHLTLRETATPESPRGGAAPHPGLWPAGSLALLWLQWIEGAGHGTSAFPSNPSKHGGSLGSPELWAGQPTAPPCCFGVLGWGRHPRRQASHNHMYLFLRPTPCPPALTRSTGDSEQCLLSEGHIGDLNIAFRLQLC
uniref:uncharacterized protein LOC128928534 n=1 Tax=Callithrix jacchus TaxID=9483 RepID=UPI0023DD1372|nr:uncharacterized protein LOC128928534 [Callithrix jacchus]